MNRLFRFLVVGGFSAAVQIAILELLYEVFKSDLSFSVTVAYLVSVAVHFFGNKYVTFSSKGIPGVREVFKYTFVVMLNYTITVMVTVFIVEKLGQPIFVAAAFSILATVFFGFVLSQIWVFQRSGPIK